MKTALCPTCGTEIKFDEFIVDLNTNTVSYHGLQRQAPLMVVELLAILSRKYPGMARTGEIISGLYGVTQYESLKNPENSLRHLVWHARKIADALDFEIASVASAGYRLILSPPLVIFPPVSAMEKCE